MMKVLCAALAACLLAAFDYHPDEPRIDYNAIARIDCTVGSGTAFWIASDRIITAAHLTAGGACAIDGHPLRIVREDGQADISELTGLANDRHLRVSCAAARRGDLLFAVGYADGLYRHTAELLAIGVRVAGEEASANGQVVLLGDVYPGMSGGPELDRQLRVRGITNRRYFGPPPHYASSRALADTFLCGAGA